MSISFTKSVGHMSDTDVQYIHISTDEITLPELEETFQSFLRACGYIIDEVPKPSLDYDEETVDEIRRKLLKED